MKLPSILLALAVSCLIALSAGNQLPSPSNYVVAQAPVLKVYTANEDHHRFVAYVVKWRNAEVVVSDPLAKSDYKVGDKISFLAQKITLGGSGSSAVQALVFSLSRANGS